MGALSKGCVACKKKKVKCDERRPTCSRCCKAGIQCTGSTPRLRFVDEKPRIRRSMAISRAQSHEFTAITNGSSHLAFHSNQINRAQSLRPPRFVPLTAFKDDICISYLLSKFFEGEHRYPFNAVGDTCVLPTEWIPELVKNTQQPHRNSWDALAAIAFGKAHKNCNVIKSAFELYGKALSELRDNLSNPNELSTDSTLASMTALYIYEILAWKADKGWMLHANGLGWLLESRGPWQQKSSVGKSIFLEHRIMLVAKSIISGQSTFLRDPVWKTVPWEDDPTSKFPIDYLVDVGADIAEYLAEIRSYDKAKHCHLDEYSQLRNQVALSIGVLNEWWLQWEAENGCSVIEVIPQWATHEPPFLTLLEYDTLWTAFTVCTYNSMRILLLQLWHMLRLFPDSDEGTDQAPILDLPNGTALLGITSDTKGLAYEIMRSLTYCYGRTTRFVTTFSFLFIQDVAYGCFDHGSEEAVWAAGHGWAEVSKDGDVRDANLLNRMVPLGQMNVGNLILGTVGEPLGFGSL